MGANRACPTPARMRPASTCAAREHGRIVPARFGFGFCAARRIVSIGEIGPKAIHECSSQGSGNETPAALPRAVKSGSAGQPEMQSRFERHCSEKHCSEKRDSEKHCSEKHCSENKTQFPAANFRLGFRPGHRKFMARIRRIAPRRDSNPRIRSVSTPAVRASPVGQAPPALETRQAAKPGRLRPAMRHRGSGSTRSSHACHDADEFLDCLDALLELGLLGGVELQLDDPLDAPRARIAGTPT